MFLLQNIIIYCSINWFIKLTYNNMIDVLLFYLKNLWFSLRKISLLYLYLGQILPNLVQFFITYSHIVIIWNTAAEDCSISSLHFRYFFRFWPFLTLLRSNFLRVHLHSRNLDGHVRPQPAVCLGNSHGPDGTTKPATTPSSNCSGSYVFS